MERAVLTKLHNIIKCQDGQDYDLFDFSQSMVYIFESLYLLSKDTETIIAISYINSNTFHKYNNIIDCQIKNIQLECEENFTLYFSYNKFKKFLYKKKDLLDFNDIEHIYYSDFKQTLFEWIDIFNTRGGSASITGNVHISNVQDFCKETDCSFKLYTI